MIERKDLGTWMDGAPEEPGYAPGCALGLPAEGSGSVAPVGRRFLTLLLDWFTCVGVSALALGGDPGATLALFAAVNIVMLTLFGATPAQFALGLRVLPVSRRLPMLVRALVRTGLLLLLIPAVIWNRDRQPLYDVLAGTAVVRA